MSHARRWTVAASAALLLAGSPVSAQRSPPAEGASQAAFDRPEAALVLVPTREGQAPSVGTRVLHATQPAVVVRSPQQRQPPSVVLMVVGGAGLVVGSLIGGDSGTMIMVGGAVIGLVGLYRYLR